MSNADSVRAPWPGCGFPFRLVGRRHSHRTPAHPGQETGGPLRLRQVRVGPATPVCVAASLDGDGSGPFSTTHLLSTAVADELRADPGVFRADPFIQARDTLKGRDVNVLGLTLGGAGWPRVRSGRLPLASGEVVIDSTLRYRLGDTVALGSWTAQVVGTSSETTYYFGMPTVFGVISDVQRGFLAGQPYATAIAVRGEPVAIPPGRASLRRARRSLTSTGRRGRALALAPDLLSPTSRLHTWTQHR